MPIVGAQGSGDGVCLALADQPYSVGVHEVLQDTRGTVITGNQEHAVGWYHGWFAVFAPLAQGVILHFFAAVLFHRFSYMGADGIVHGFC